MLAQQGRGDKGKEVGWDLLLTAIIAPRDFVPSRPGEDPPAPLPSLSAAPVSGPPKLRLAGCLWLAPPDMSSFTFSF